MDVLTDWLREIVTGSVVLSRCNLSSPWGLQIDSRFESMFHIVMQGACWLSRPGAPPLRLLQGDLVLLPQGIDHSLADDPDTPCESLDHFLARTSFPSNGESLTTVVCGTYRSEAQLVYPILATMPPVVYFPAASVHAKPSLSATLSLLAAEIEQPAPGGDSLLQNLFDVLFVYVVRAWADDATTARPGWFTALNDPSLSKALSRMHASPADPWTVDLLARSAGLSRAAFARRFAEEVGEPPLAYLTRWRMGLAVRLLRTSEASVSEIAQRIGYESEFAFSRAFKRSQGLAPATFRRRLTA